MLSVYFKEIHAFFSTLIGYIVIGVFLISVGLFMWVFSDTSVLDYNFATMDQLFSIAPLVFLFLIPAVTMRSFAEERAKGTIELLYTKPLTNYSIIGGKYLANMTLVVFALLPTLLYYYSVYQLGSPVGNLDTGAIIGSYIGLFFLSAAFVAIGMFASTLTNNQIVAFVLGAFLCFFFHWAFQYIAKMPIFTSGLDLFVQKLGINYHYASISKGLLDSRDIIYFISVVFVFIYATVQMLEKRK
ncbi:MAG: gliding motility-associated ABC transporter permease subunit GldF [Saprospiraceae bacterium]|nr:gliding motility-associated ABC transporter permease subunit GldF [Saprospiraceae bacterium]MCZ2337790.1 gliding motility-associated ABC transporter permease subunit GldF [Chitinophagales bacterium]